MAYSTTWLQNVSSLMRSLAGRIDWHIAAIFSAVICANAYNTPAMFFIDTKSFLHNFHSFYNELMLNGQVNLWDPFNMYGSSTDIRNLLMLSAPLSFAAVAGMLLGVMDSFTVLSFGIMLEQLIYVTGVVLLGRCFFCRKTVLLLGLAAALTNIWHVQIWFNFRIYSLMPLTLYLLVRCFEQRRPVWLWMAGVVFILSLLGSPGYVMPVLAFIILVFGGCAFAAYRKGLGELWTPARWLSPATLAAMALFLAIAWGFAQYCNTLLEYVVVGPGGRDASSGQVLFRHYLFALSSQEKSLSSFWELIYAAPRDGITNMYAGLFSLVFFAYALLRRHRIDSPGFRPALAGIAASVGISLSSLTILAPALYVLFPLMDRTRYLCSYLAMVKFFLLLCAAFGLDAFLRSQEADGEDARLERRTVALLGFSLCAFILVMDLVFRGFPYPDASVPYTFHFVAVGLLAVYCAHLASTRPGGGPSFGLLAALMVTELASYLFLVLLALQPADIGAQAQREESERYRTVREDKAYRESQRRLFTVAPYAYQSQRVPREMLPVYNHLAWSRLKHYGFDYPDSYNSVYVDVCDPGFAPQLLPQGLVRWEQAKQGLDLDEPFKHTSLWFANNIMDPGRYLGCASPKAFLAPKVFEASGLAEAAEYIHEVSGADIVPAVLPAELAFAPARREDKAIRAKVDICVGGRCAPGRIDDAAQWKGVLKWANGQPVAIMLSHPGPKQLAKYRLKAIGTPDAVAMPKAWSLLGSNDGVNWVRLDSQRDQVGWKPEEHRDYALAERPVYKFFVLNIEEGNKAGEMVLGRFDLLRFAAEEEGGASRRPVDVTSFSMNSVEMRAQVGSGADQWLVYLDNADPGWRAFVDGVPARLYVANMAFKALRLPPGEHRVRFEYVGRGHNALLLKAFMAAGCAFSLVMIACMIALVLRRGRAEAPGVAQ